MLFRLFVFALLFLTAMNVLSQTPQIETGVSQSLAKWRATHYSDVRYKLNLTLEKMSPVLKGTIEINVKLKTENGELNSNDSQIVLDWRKLRGKEDLSTVSNVFVNGKAARFEEINEHLIFKEGVKAGENVVKLDFTSPILTSGSAITRYIDKKDEAEYVYSLFVPSDASTAFPVFDQPDLKARFNLKIKTPDDWKVISNSGLTRIQTLPTSHSEDARKRLSETAFIETQPISTYVFAFAAGNFTEFEDSKRETISIETAKDVEKNNGIATRIYLETPKIYVRQSQAEKFKPHAAETFRLNREAVKYLESYFDYKFPFPKYDLVLIPEFPFGGMEHAGATFLREDRVIFPTEPTKNDFITRANLIFHEAAHQWFGDTVTMRWFDDLWLKEGFAEFMAYKTLEQVMPEYNSWKIFYERNKQAAYLTDSTKGTTPIYQEIPNLSAAKSAYGNIVYRKAPSFLRQAEFYLGADKFQTAVRQFLKKHQFANAEWTDLVKEFETASGQDLKDWANVWVKQKGLPTFTTQWQEDMGARYGHYINQQFNSGDMQSTSPKILFWKQKIKVLIKAETGVTVTEVNFEKAATNGSTSSLKFPERANNHELIFPNYQDYGYGIFLLDWQSSNYVQKNIQNEKDDFLRTMMWGALWDLVREAELDPKVYVELVVKNLRVETDESTIQALLGRVGVAMNCYLPNAQSKELAARVETVLLDHMAKAKTAGQRITFYRAFLNHASTNRAKKILKDILANDGKISLAVDVKTKTETDAIRLVPISLPLKTKDRFDIITRLLILNDTAAPQLLTQLEKSESSDEAKRYAYAARAGIGTAENKAKFWSDFVGNKELRESWIEASFASFNSPRHSELTLPYLKKALAELPNLKRSRKIFFVNGWLAAFIGGQKSEEALKIVNNFLTSNPNLDKDLRLKILENADGLERAVKIREKYGK